MNWMVSSKDPDYEEKNRVSSYRGYLLKMRRSNNLLAPQWGKRWFSLEGRFLRWYRLDTDAIPSGQIDLRHVRSISKVDINGAYTFCVSSEDRNLIVRANSIVEMNGWIRSLHMQADIARGGSGMTVVSDFNDLPFSNAIFHPRRSSKSKTSLTLEQQLDLNLRKLNELELELSHPSDELSPEPARCEQNYIYEEKEDDDSPGTLQYFSPNNTRNKSGKRRQGGHYISNINNRNPLAEAPSSQFTRLSHPSRNIPHTSSSNTTNGVLRCISTESFENENLDYSLHDRNENNDIYTTSNGNTEDCAEVAVGSVPIQTPPHSNNIRSCVRTTDSTTTTTLTGGDISYPSGDELERSLDSEYDLPVDTIRRVQPHSHVGAKFMPTSTSIYVNPLKHNNRNNNKGLDSQLVHSSSSSNSKIRSVSSESAESSGCLYIPDISEATSGNNRSNSNNNSNSCSNNRTTKAAWG